MKSWEKGIFLFIVLTFFSYPTLSQINKIETDDLELVSYDFGHQYILPHATRCFHQALEFHKKLFNYQPTEKTFVLIQDFGDYGNAGATAIPYNFISMGLSPFSYAFETSPAGERIFSMMNHELVHVTALDNAASGDLFWQRFFGGKVHPTADNPLSMFYSYLTNPRMYAPRWYHEGIAAYVETWMNGGVGLAMGSYDEMVFRTLVSEGARIYDAQGLESEGVTTDFQGRTNSYLYGTRFMGYLAYQYGPDKIIEWVKRPEGSKAFFASQFKRVFGLPIQEGWDNWVAWEKEWQNNNMEVIRSHPLTETTVISDEKFGSVSYAYLDKARNNLFLAVNYPGEYPHLAALNTKTGKLQNLTDIKGPALFYVSSVIYDEEDQILYFTSDNNSWRDLRSYNLRTGKAQMLQEDTRTGDLAFNRSDKSIWGIKHLNGYSTIVKIPRHHDNDSNALYSTWEQVYTLPYGQDIFDIDISPDGKLMSAAVSDLQGNQSLLFYEVSGLLSGNISADTVFNFEVSSPQGFRFTEDGQHLIGSSYYSGVSNIFKVNVETKRIEALSNALTGLFRPIEMDSLSLLAFEYTSSGFRPVMLDHKRTSGISSIDFLGNITIEKYPQLSEWEIRIPTPESMDLSDFNYSEEEYSPLNEVQLNYAYPTLIGYKNVFGLGYKFNFSDPINFKELNLNIGYTPRSWTNHLSSLNDSLVNVDAEERFHVSFTARSRDFTLSGSLNEASFYDLFGPRIASRKGLKLGLQYDKSLIWDLPRRLDLVSNLNGFYGLDRSPEFQQITTTGFSNSFFIQASTHLTYKYLKRSLGGVESEKGISTDVHLSLIQSDGQLFPRASGSFDYGISLPLAHSSLWFRGAIGHSFETDFNPFTRYAFASFGNNYVDYHDFRQYRNPYSFAGLTFNNDFSIIAKSYSKLMAEWILPPWRYRKLGGFNFFANWTQLSFFSSVLRTYNPALDSANYMNFGGQISTRMVMFSHLPATLSIGYARAWQLGEDRKFGEFMVSLKLLR